MGSKPTLILLAGGSGSGKSSFIRQFVDVSSFSTDDFYFGKSKMKSPYNFDDPASVDFSSVLTSVATLLQMKNTQIPIFDPLISEPIGVREIQPKGIIVVEGIFALHDRKLRSLAQLKVYLDVPASERIRRRIERDSLKGRDMFATLEYSQHVEREHMRWVEPQKKWADLILSG